jgi:hypothetical protein
MFHIVFRPVSGTYLSLGLTEQFENAWAATLSGIFELIKRKDF